MKGRMLFVVVAVFCLSTLVPRFAPGACSYFAARDKDINQPGQKAFITWDPERQIESFTVQPKFEGNALDFGMVIPTPARPKLDEMPRDFFKDLAIYTILMPLPQRIWTGLEPIPETARAGGSSSGLGNNVLRRKEFDSVRVIESGVVGSLDYKIIVAEDAGGLEAWLRENEYSYAGDKTTLDYYIQKKWIFTVMKIDPGQMKKAPDGSYTGEVTPTRFTFRSVDCIYPLKITQISVRDETDALFYVHTRRQMDLQADWSWMHSYRIMYLTSLGKRATSVNLAELARRQQWLQQKKQRDPRFQTTKLEWARRLGSAETAVLEDPLKNYAQMGIDKLSPGDELISLEQLLDEVKAAYEKTGQPLGEYQKRMLAQMGDRYQSAKGLIVKTRAQGQAQGPGQGRVPTYNWYPNREAPESEVKGLVRLKGHLQKEQWLTKFRKILRKVEMTEDILLRPVESGLEQSYMRILNTSPP